MEQIISTFKKISFKIYLKFLLQALVIYFLVNLCQFLYYYINIDEVSSFKFDNGAFWLNNIKIGKEIANSLGFIGLLFIVPFVSYLYKKKVFKI